MLDKIIKEGQKYGEILATLSRAQETTVNYEQDKFSSSTSGYSDSLKIKIVRGNKFGFARTTDLSRWKDCLMTAVKIMKVSPELPHKQIISEPTKLKPLFSDKKIERLDEQKLDKLAEPALNFALEKETSVPQISITSIAEETRFANSNKVNFSCKKSLLSFFMDCVKGEATGSEGHVSRKIFDPAKYAKEAVELCLSSQNPKPIGTMKADLILDYFAFSNLIGNILIPAFYADKVQNKKSILCGKLGKQFFSKKINICDDGTSEKGLLTMPADAEGTKSQKTVLVKNGIIKNFLYDNYSAAIEGRKSTGNCSDISRTPYISATNFCISSGDYSREELISETKSGVIARYIMGGHVVNDITGDVSVGLANAFVIESGEIKHPIKQIMISFNFFEALRKISELGKTARQESNVSAPLVRLKNIQFIS